MGAGTGVGTGVGPAWAPQPVLGVHRDGRGCRWCRRLLSLSHPIPTPSVRITRPVHRVLRCFVASSIT